MPAAVRYIKPTSADRNNFATQFLSEREARRRKYRQALKYYLGEQDPQLVVEDETDPDDNLTINLVQMTADRTVSFLFPEIPKIETDPTSIEDTPEETWIKDFFEANGGLAALAKLALRGFLAGHSFVRLKPIPKERIGEPDVFPSMLVLDPTMVTIYWKADDVADVLWYELRYMVGSRVYIQDFVNVGAAGWLIYTYRTVEDQNDAMDAATLHGQGDSIFMNMLEFNEGVFEQVGKPAVHTSRIPPIIEFPHLPHPDDRYGLSEFTQKDLQDAINRIASERNRIVRENSDPIDVITGAGANEVEDEGSLITIDNAAARVSRLEMKGDLTGITTVLDKLIETYLAIARVVLLKGEAKDLQRVTNASVRTLFLDALSKNKILQSSYGSALKKLVKLALLMGFEAKQLSANPENIKLKLTFATPLPTDDTEIANINAISVNGGWMSPRTAATSQGLDWEFEHAAIEQAQQEANDQALVQGEIAAQNAAKLPQPKQVPPGA